MSVTVANNAAKIGRVIELCKKNGNSKIDIIKQTAYILLPQTQSEETKTIKEYSNFQHIKKISC